MKLPFPKQDNQNAEIEIYTNYGEIIESEASYRDCKKILADYRDSVKTGRRDMLVIISNGYDITRRHIRVDTIVEIRINTTKKQ